jgi:hypothetical protein
MKQRTKEKATEWLKTAKKGDKFSIDTVPHSKKEIEELLGIKEKSYADMGQTFDEGHSEEPGVGTSESTE